MKKITPHLWFDKEAREAAEFYTSIFENSKIKNVTTLKNTPSGDCDLVSFDLCGQEFMAISAGPIFKFNPSVSFQVKCTTKKEVDTLWEKLAAGGNVLMELQKYPFSERYGWCSDKYGLSWQVNFVGESDVQQKIIPALMFVGNMCGKTEEAINFYTSIFPNSETGILTRHESSEAPDKEGTIKYATFSLEGLEFAAMDSAYNHKFAFNEAISFLVKCDTQKEINYYWEKLSAVPASEQCGWLKDKYGLSWQVIPSIMDEMLKEKDEKRLARVTEAFLKMKKFDIETLKRAYTE